MKLCDTLRGIFNYQGQSFYVGDVDSSSAASNLTCAQDDNELSDPVLPGKFITRKLRCIIDVLARTLPALGYFLPEALLKISSHICRPSVTAVENVA